jgi:hypothetical protein
MAIVLYASEIQSEGSVPIVIGGWRKDPEKTIYIRAELMEDEWPGPAADKAKPREREVVLNAVPNKVVVVPKVKPAEPVITDEKPKEP